MNQNIYSVKLSGIHGIITQVECCVEEGSAGIHVVGISNSASIQCVNHTVKALESLGFHVPHKKIVVNFAPADRRKETPAFDLPMALALFSASGENNGLLPGIHEYAAIGELGPDGSVRPVLGALQAVETARKNGMKGCIIPEENLPAIVELLDDAFPVYPVKTLEKAIGVIRNPDAATTARMWYSDLLQREPELNTHVYAVRPSDTWELITRDDCSKRAVEIAAAGGHPLLLVGPPDSCKSLIASSLRNLLPSMDEDETMATASIYSASGNESRHFRDVLVRPLRAPHVSSSIKAMLGGGLEEDIRPGEASLAHNGVLFLNDFISAPNSLLQALRGPLEDKHVTISKILGYLQYPADFHLVAATKPCPCGHYGEGERCTCTPKQREQWLSRFSGPIYDHLTIQAWCRTPNENAPVGESFSIVYERVQKAIAIQQNRFAGEPYKHNDDIPAKDIEKYCPLDDKCREVLERLIAKLGLSARAYFRIIRIARTIADLEGKDNICGVHLVEAASFRFLDRRPSFYSK